MATKKGLIWQEIKQLYNNGAKDYLRSWNNIFNSLMNVIYVSSFGLKYYTMIMVRITKNRVLNEQFWEKASTLNETDYAGQKDAYNAIYWLNNGNSFSLLNICILNFVVLLIMLLKIDSFGSRWIP